MVRRFFPLLVLLLFSACQKDEGQEDDTRQSRFLANVPYGGDTRQIMDIYLPGGRSVDSTRVMILIHGGGWSSGDKSDFDMYVDTLKNRLPGYAIFNLNYRLAAGSSNNFPAQENDIKAAIEFIFSKRNEYGISDKFVLLGASAGAHLSLLQAYKYNTPVRIRSVVDFFGPADLTEMYNHPASILAPPDALADVIGATPSSNPALYEQSSPIHFITGQSPPTIIFHGGIDPLVAPSQATALQNRLQSAGVIHQYVFYPLATHGWAGATLTHSFDAIQTFLEANVN